MCTSASKAFSALNGVICVYKPACVSVRAVQHTVITNLCRDLNNLPDREREPRMVIESLPNASMKVKLVPNYADDPLVVGPRYQNQDFRCSVASHLGLFTSGLLLLGINDGTKLTFRIHASRPIRAYKVQGELGKATDTYFWNGRTVERATYKHITRERIDSVVAHMQAAHQKAMYELSGLHMDSQAMYDMAVRGPVRPSSKEIPVVYGIKCVYFEPPHFTLEIHAINEYEKYLWTLVHDLGMQMRTVAHCTAVQCIRQGLFDLDFAMLRKHWRLNNIVDNINECSTLLDENPRLLKQKSFVLK